jgi:hypothetical protein
VLCGAGCDTVVEHAPCSAVARRATAAGSRATAKTVALHDPDGYRLAVLPASGVSTCAAR